jgi:hypothetical protein
MKAPALRGRGSAAGGYSERDRRELLLGVKISDEIIQILLVQDLCERRHDAPVLLNGSPDLFVGSRCSARKRFFREQSIQIGRLGSQFERHVFMARFAVPLVDGLPATRCRLKDEAGLLAAAGLLKGKQNQMPGLVETTV